MRVRAVGDSEEIACHGEKPDARAIACACGRHSVSSSRDHPPLSNCGPRVRDNVMRQLQGGGLGISFQAGMAGWFLPVLKRNREEIKGGLGEKRPFPPSTKHERGRSPPPPQRTVRDPASMGERATQPVPQGREKRTPGARGRQEGGMPSGAEGGAGPKDGIARGWRLTGN